MGRGTQGVHEVTGGAGTGGRTGRARSLDRLHAGTTPPLRALSNAFAPESLRLARRGKRMTNGGVNAAFRNERPP